MNKMELVDWLNEQNRHWEALLDRIGAAHMDQPGVNQNGWSMKDMIAHLTVWQQRNVAGFDAAQRGEPEPPMPWPAHLEDEDEVNAWIYESNRERSASEVLRDARQVHQRLVAVMASLTEDVLIEIVEPDFYLVRLGVKRYPVGEFFYHFRDDHEPDVRGWLARVEKE